MLSKAAQCYLNDSNNVDNRYWSEKSNDDQNRNPLLILARFCDHILRSQEEEKGDFLEATFCGISLPFMGEKGTFEPVKRFSIL